MTFLERLESLNPEQIIADLRSDIATAKTDLESAKAEAAVVLTSVSSLLTTIGPAMAALMALMPAGSVIPAEVTVLEAAIAAEVKNLQPLVAAAAAKAA